MTWLEIQDQLPPNIAWLIARDLKSRGQPIPLKTIAQVSGIAFGRVKVIAVQVSWSYVTCGERDAFLRACQITPKNFYKVHLRYLRRTQTKEWPMAHLSNTNRATRRALNRTLK
jgi:hypothetical protein